MILAIHMVEKCAAPKRCNLVYKAHEYYSYKYHKPEFNLAV